MSFFSSVSPKVEVPHGFASMAALGLTVSFFAVKYLGSASDLLWQHTSGIGTRARLEADFRTAVDRSAITARNLVLGVKSDDLEFEKTPGLRAHYVVTSAQKRLSSAIANASYTLDRGRELVAEINRVEGLYGRLALKIVNLALNDKHEDAIMLMNDNCRPLVAALVRATNDYSSYAAEQEVASVERAKHRFTTEHRVLVGISLISLVAALIAAPLIICGSTRAFGAEPGALGKVARQVASADLRPVPGADFSLNRSVLFLIYVMQRSLTKLIIEMRSAADSIPTGSSEIATGKIALSSTTQPQAASLQEIASTMEQLASTVRRNADSAAQARSLACNAFDVASKGSSVVGEVVATLADVGLSATKIYRMRAITESTTFQTRILALNAAVEDSRSGEQGCGIDVVASEVRSLAQRSSTVVKEINFLIYSTVQEIQAGSPLASEAGIAMSDRTKPVAQINDILGEITTASSEESQAIEQRKRAIVQMDDVKQQNAALIVLAAAASQPLEEQGHKLTQAISTFRVHADRSLLGKRRGDVLVRLDQKAPLPNFRTSAGVVLEKLAVLAQRTSGPQRVKNVPLLTGKFSRRSTII